MNGLENPRISLTFRKLDACWTITQDSQDHDPKAQDTLPPLTQSPRRGNFCRAFFSCTTCAWAMADSEMMQNALLQIFSMARSVGTREAMRPRLHLLPLHCLSCFQLLWRLSAAWWHQDKEIFLVMNDMERQDHHLDCWLPSYQSHTTKAELISTMLRVRYTRRKHHYCPIQIDSTVSVDPRTQQFYE